MRSIIIIGMIITASTVYGCSGFVHKMEVRACLGEMNKAIHYQVQHDRKDGVKSFTLAKKFCEKANAVKPNDEYIKLALVNAYTCLGEFKKAQKIVNTYDKQSADKPILFQIKRAQVIANTGKYDCFAPKLKLSVTEVLGAS